MCTVGSLVYFDHIVPDSFLVIFCPILYCMLCRQMYVCLCLDNFFFYFYGFVESFQLCPIVVSYYNVLVISTQVNFLNDSIDVLTRTMMDI